MEKVIFNGWNSLRLANKEIELIVTRDVGPRIIRLGYLGETNMFRQMPDPPGAANEAVWQIRGGHRFWVAPEAKPWSYELDNCAYAEAAAIPNGLRTRQEAGPITGLAKQMEVTLDPDHNVVTLIHTLTNAGEMPVVCAPWAPTVMNRNGQAIIPLPAKISHTVRLTHNQTWSVWPYSDFSDPRWTFGSQYILFRQDPHRGPNKLGIAHREKWTAYQLDGFLFVKWFEHFDDQTYPDGGCSFETFANEDFLELESLGPMTTLNPGNSVSHTEKWQLFKNVPLCHNDADVVKHILPLL